MSLSSTLGYYHFARTRGRQYLDDVRPWLQLGMVGSVATKYLGLTTTQSVLVGVAILVLAEIAMLAFGWFDARNGIIRAQQALVNEQDPFRVEMLSRVASIERELTALREWATRTGS